MAQIIEFPVQQSNAYSNLSRLIDIASSTKEVNFYADAADAIKDSQLYRPGEYEKLVKAYRAKRLELVTPDPQEPEKAEEPGVYTYTPEMGQSKPDCQMEASRSYYGGHVYIDTPIELKGRGIKELDAHWCEGSRKAKEHWRSYRVTNKAYDKLKQQYAISMEMLLD